MYQLASSGSNLRSRQSFADGTSPCLTTPPSADVPSALPQGRDDALSPDRVFAGVDPANEVGGIAIPVDMRNLQKTRFRRERR